MTSPARWFLLAFLGTRKAFFSTRTGFSCLPALALLLGVLSPFAATPAEAHGHPDPPRNVQVQVVSEATALKLIWQAPSSWGGSPAGGYEIDRYQGDSEPGEESTDWRQINPDRSASDTSFTLADVTYGAKYYLRIRSFSNSGDPQDPKVVGNWVVRSGTPIHTHGPPPGKPTLTALTSVQGVPPTATTLSFSITCVRPGLGGVTDFIFYAENTSDSSDTHTWNYSPVPLTCQDSSDGMTITVTMTGFPRRTSTTTYNVSARARNILGRKSAWSDSVQATTTAHSMQIRVVQPPKKVEPPQENPQDNPQEDAGPKPKKLPPEPPPKKVDGASGGGDGVPPPNEDSPLPEEPLLSPDDGGSGREGDATPPPSANSPLPGELSDPTPPSTRCGASDREDLESFYDKTGGDNWRENTDWKSPEPPKQWYGVETDEEENVVSLRLSENNLSGEIPSKELLCLSELKELALWGNEDLSGEVPEELVLAVERAVLRDIAETLDLNPEWFEDYEDPFDFEDWHPGVTTDDEGRVTELDLTGEGVLGDVPESVSEFRRLREIMTTRSSSDGGCALSPEDSSAFSLFLLTLFVFAVAVRKRARD